MGNFISSHTQPKSRLVYTNGEGHTSPSPPQPKQTDLDNKNKEMPMATQIYTHVKSCNNLRHDNRCAYLYDVVLGHYRKLSSADWVHLLKIHCTQGTRHLLMKRHCTEAFDLLIGDPELYMEFNGWRTQNPLKIPCKNGILNLETMDVTQYSEWNAVSTSFDLEYIPNANLEEAKAFMTFARSSLDYDNEPELTNLLLICLGYVLSGSNRWRKAIVLLGPTACGKSVMASFLQKVVGNENCSNVSLGRLGEKFRTIKLAESVVNITYELENNCIKNVDIFKSVVSGDVLSDQRKHVDEMSFTPTAKLFMCSNVLPGLGKNQGSGADDPVFDRFVFIPFKRSVPPEERDTELINKLWEERSIIMSVALELFYYGLHTKGYITPDCESSKECMVNFKREQNVFETFVEDHIIFDPKARVSIAAIRNAYDQYCWQNVFKNDMGNAEIKAFFRNKYPQVQYDKFRLPDNKVLWGFKGISLIK